MAISEVAKAYLVDLPGYTYEALPPTIEQQMAVTFGSNAAARGAIKGYATEAVKKGSTSVGLIIVLELDPSVASTPGLEQGFWAGAAGSAGGQLTESTIAGKTVHVIDAPSSKVVGWMDGALVVMVIGTGDEVPAVAEALIKAHA